MSKQVLFLTFFITLTVLFMPIFGRKLLIPFYYLPIYLFLIYKILLSQHRLLILNKYIFYILIVFSVACLFTFKNIVYNLDFIKYFLMWILNLYLASYISLNDKMKTFFKSSTISSIILISLFPLYHVLGYEPSNFFNSYGFNVNQLSFLVIFSIFFLLFENKNKLFQFLIIIPLFYLKSRMLILQSILLLLFKFKYKRLLFIISFPVVCFLFFKLSIFSLLIEMYDILILSNLDLAMNFDDSRRLSLLVSGIKVIHNLFPYGSGLGLENFTHYSSLFFLDDVNFRSSMTHNFYISYTGVFGILAFPFICSLIAPIFSIKSFLKNFVVILFFGIAFNEYITSPYFWVVYGTFLQRK